MKKIIPFSSLILVLVFTAQAQQKTNYPVLPFNKIIISPHINVILTEGPEEKVEVSSRNVDESDIHVDIDGQTLRVYLEGARMTPRNDKRTNAHREWYRDADVTAYITYKDLKKLSVRGDQRVECESALHGKRFTLKTYGDNRVIFVISRN